MNNDHLIITVNFEGEPTFSGIRSGEDPFEWPPSPARLISALVAGAASNPENFEACIANICILERLPDPVIVAAAYQTEARDPLHFAPKVTDYPTTSWTVDKKNDLTPPTTSRKSKAYENSLRKGVWPGFKGMSEVANVGKRINGARTLIHPEVTYYVQVPKSQDLNHLATVLDQAAEGIPYFGASRDSATVKVTAGSFIQPESKTLAIYRPLKIRGRDKGWSPGLVDHLLKRHQLLTTEATDIGHPDHIVRKLSYQAVSSEDSIPTLTVAVAKSIRITDTAKHLEAINQVVAEKKMQVRILPMVNHLHSKSDGVLKGILIVPDPIADPDGFNKIAEAAPDLVDPDKIPWLDEFSVSTGHDQALQSMRPGSILKPYAKWRSATPVRSYPGTEYALARLLLDLQAATDVNADEIHLNIYPATPATKVYGCGHTLGKTDSFDQSMTSWHVEATFPSQVPGPIQIGADTKLGYGLLVPNPQLFEDGEHK